MRGTSLVWLKRLCLHIAGQTMIGRPSASPSGRLQACESYALPTALLAAAAALVASAAASALVVRGWDHARLLCRLTRILCYAKACSCWPRRAPAREQLILSPTNANHILDLRLRGTDGGIAALALGSLLSKW